MTDLRGEPLLSVRDLSVHYGATVALSGVDLDLHEGSFVGIVGPSGAGKSTLLRSILGLVKPSGGSVERHRRCRTGYVPQLGSVDRAFPLTVTECVLLANATERNLPWSTRAERAQAEVMLESLGIGGLGHRHLHELSGGQQQRVFVARALMAGSELIVLDEPTSGVDVPTRHEVLHLLSDLHDSGRSIVLATHDLNGLATHLPELVCLAHSVVARGTPTEVLTPEVLEATYGAPFEVLVHSGLPFVVDAPRVAPGHHHRAGRIT